MSLRLIVGIPFGNIAKNGGFLLYGCVSNLIVSPLAPLLNAAILRLIVGEAHL